ncbi:adenylate kinase, chloroplastic isoform X1 [Zea mays]|nr:Adenylate kinase, chloroplastic [Zea mays]XP_020394520.1 uncharacterized protein LOC100281242 isoform X1 [Zea mays]XP_020394521.1 uncharacterized protein LOC100281242 isoform X1 [Zea mays]ACF82802.1 unknown [Zea mays]ACG26837.1 adenylate kinase [Zea mays]AQK78135.1 adenylate kinase1 [Zea mays]AQK78136.1 adenylate kinase1 [Zea mays]|eukprot:XP_020394520.1 adenylate kinase 1 isoform X1 [Zea mays]
MASSMAAAATALPLPSGTTQRPSAQGRLLFTAAPARSRCRSLRLRPAGRRSARSSPRATKAVVAALADPLKVMISGAPASGKGTQCELIKTKYQLAHISAGDLLRAEIAAGSENGKRAKEFMEKGQLVPDEIVVNMVKERLRQPDAQENGWLLDGYPRSYSQAMALETLEIRPDTFILLDVPDELLVERVVGRRLDPVTGKIYHLKYSPPENEEIASRLTQRFDDTEEKVKLRLETYYQNIESLLSTYENIIVKVQGDATVDAVFAKIDELLGSILEKKNEMVSST